MLQGFRFTSGCESSDCQTSKFSVKNVSLVNCCNLVYCIVYLNLCIYLTACLEIRPGIKSWKSRAPPFLRESTFLSKTVQSFSTSLD